MRQYDEVIVAAMDSLLHDESLYKGLTDREATILTKWADEQLGLAVYGAPNVAVAHRWAAREVAYMQVLFPLIVEATDEKHWDRGMVIAVMTSLISKLSKWMV
jgi:hypothetical protein